MVQITIEGEREREREERWQRMVVLSERGFPHYDIIIIWIPILLARLDHIDVANKLKWSGSRQSRDVFISSIDVVRKQWEWKKSKTNSHIHRHRYTHTNTQTERSNGQTQINLLFVMVLWTREPFLLSWNYSIHKWFNCGRVSSCCSFFLSCHLTHSATVRRGDVYVCMLILNSDIFPLSEFRVFFPLCSVCFLRMIHRQPTTVWNWLSWYKFDSVPYWYGCIFSFIENTQRNWFIWFVRSFAWAVTITAWYWMSHAYIITSMAKQSQYLVSNGKCVCFP